MAITDSIKWRIDDVNFELTRNTDNRNVFVYQRGNNLPQFMSMKEAAALSMQIRRMVDRSDFSSAFKSWDKKTR